MRQYTKGKNERMTVTFTWFQKLKSSRNATPTFLFEDAQYSVSFGVNNTDLWET